MRRFLEDPAHPAAIEGLKALARECRRPGGNKQKAEELEKKARTLEELARKQAEREEEKAKEKGGTAEPTTIAKKWCDDD